MEQALIIGVRHQPDHVLVTVAGEIDIATAPQLRDRLAALAASGRQGISLLHRVKRLGLFHHIARAAQAA